MQKLGLTQSLNQKLSPQQIQFIKLLQIPTAELDTRIEEELEINPALEEGMESKEEEIESAPEEEVTEKEEEINVEDYLQEDDFTGYKMQGDGNYGEEDKEMPIPMATTLNDQLISQLGFMELDERQTMIGKQLIGSIEADGYIRRELEAIINDLAFSQNIDTNLEELEELLGIIQTFDPPGIAARNLQECLLLQLERKDDSSPDVQNAINILTHSFNEFTKKHYQKIIKKLDLESEEELKEAIQVITKLNPKPGGVSSSLVKTQFRVPDFIIENEEGSLRVILNSRNAPELRVSRSYSEMMDSYNKSDKKDKKLKDTVSFVKQKLDAAKWFIDAIKQRQQTLLNTMTAILEYQYDFFFRRGRK